MSLPLPPVVTAYVGLGSNLGDRAGHLLLAVREILRAGLTVARMSSIYETEPLDVGAQPMFLNMVAELTGALPSPEHLLTQLLNIENALGRRRRRPRAARTIDLDLLLYGDAQVRTELLTLPHPRLHLRRFVLTPLAELAPHVPHPRLGKTVGELLTASRDVSQVDLWHPRKTGAE